MPHSPTAHAGAALAALSAKLESARAEQARSADRLSALEAELALDAARLSEEISPEPEAMTASKAHRRSLLNRRVADLLELRASLIAERAKRRRLIDETAQRKEAIGAALAVLREKAAPPVGAAH